MSPDADALKAMAANRGLKLRRSRVRSPDKQGFNTFGLVDDAGAEVFGFSHGKPAADAGAVADYLRGSEVQDWKASLKQLGAAIPPPSRPAEAAPAPPAQKNVKPERGPELRHARKGDAKQLANLFTAMNQPIAARAVAANLKALEQAGEPIVVLARDQEILGAIGLHSTPVPHRLQRVGRITVLVVAEPSRRRGFGRLLVAEAERRLAKLGCGLIEVTSNDRLADAHAFYRHLGYERTSMRFAKPLSTR